MERKMRVPDDLDAYLSTLPEAERTEIEIAGASIDLAILLYRAREELRLTQAAAAAKAGLAQQAVSRLEQPPANPRFDTLRRYLGALGYDLELKLKNPTTGNVVAELRLPTLPSRDSEQRTATVVDRELVGTGTRTT
jgi:transcriptional regulator with XRE-family HTH domain